MHDAALDEWDDIVPALARRLGLRTVPPVLAPWTGATSTVLHWGGFAVKVPHDDPDAVRACLRHAEMSLALARLGVAVPEIVLVADDLHPTVPLIVSRLLPGTSLAPGEAPRAVWRQVGAQLVIIHGASADQVPSGLRRYLQSDADDPRVVTAELLAAGRLAREVAARLLATRDRLHDRIRGGFTPVLCHGDMHAANVVADRGRLSGLLDLAGAGWLDSAWDFAAIPAAAVPHPLDGYRAAGGATESLPARVAWCRMQLGLERARHEPEPPAAWQRLFDGIASLAA